MIWKFLLAFLAFLRPTVPPTNDLNSDITLLYKPKPYEPQTPQEEAIAKRALQRAHRGGDMILPKRSLGNIWKDEVNRWPGYPGSGKIPYVIDKSINTQYHDLIKRAMEQYNKLTCVKFSPRKSEKDYIKIFNGTNDGCWSYVGKNGGMQELSLGIGCEYIGTIVHELGHALGFLHEHQRSDRDKYITILKKNITSGFEDQFYLTPAKDEIIANAFDYNSIMIYGNYAFSKSDGKLMTIVAKNGVQLTEPYNKPGLDNSDIDRVKVMYKCKK